MQGALRAVEKKQLPHMLCVTNMLLHGIEDPSFVRHDNTLARPLTSAGRKDERVDIVLTNPPFGGREEDGIENNFPTLPHQGDGRPVPRPHHAPAEIRRPRRRGAARWHAVRRRRQDAAEGTSDGGVQPPHHRPPAQFGVSSPMPGSAPTCCSSRRARQPRKSGSTSTACPRARKPIR